MNITQNDNNQLQDNNTDNINIYHKIIIINQIFMNKKIIIII